MSSPLDLAPAIAMLAFDEITISRRTRTYNAQGVLVLSDPEEIGPFAANVQTLGAAAGQSAGGRAGLAGTTGANVDQTRHGQRTYGGIVVFSTTEILAADDVSGQQSDEVTYNGVVYSVSHVDPWTASNYWRAVCVKKEV